jgi:uncharacterized membrane protein
MAAQRPAGGGRPGGSRQPSGRQANSARPAGGGRPADGGRPAGGGKPAGGRAKTAGRVPVSKAPGRQASVTPAAAGKRPAAAGPVSKPPPGLPDAPGWLRWSTLILSVAGLGVSIYLTIEHYTANSYAGCAENSTVNCTKVTTSAQSVVFGIFPVAVLGLAFFVFMVAANSPWAWNWKLPALRWLRLASVVVGIGFVLYLVYAELFQIQAICLYCTSVHVITFLLFAIIVYDSTFRHAPSTPAPPLQRR